MEIAGLVVAVAIAFAGWIAKGRQEQSNARRNLRVEYLLSAYRSLDSVTNRQPLTLEQGTKLEDALSDVKFLGSRRQIELAEEFAADYAAGGGPSLKPLLSNLRSDLRSELQLDPVPERKVWLRVNP